MATRRARPTSDRAVCRTAFVAALAVAAVFLPSPAVASVGGETVRRTALELAQERLDDARRLATEAAEKLAAAETLKGQLESEIVRAEAEIPLLQARADELGRIVRVRAARLYVQQSTPPFDAVVHSARAVDAARATHMTEAMGKHDESMASELQETARILEARQVQLRTQRAELERTIAAITPIRTKLDERLAFAAAAFDLVQAALARSAGALDVDTGAALCPVQGFVVFTDDFGEPRHDGRAHLGIDMPALEGTPVVAVVDGLLLLDESPAGGHGAWLHGSDDVSYYYAHFNRYEGPSRLVQAGEVIGYVGSTGVSTGPHLHFEVHPHGGPAVNGFALLVGLCAEETVQPRR